jgi:hypothetical protein
MTIMDYQIRYKKGLVGFAILGRYHSRYGVNRPERIILACIQVLDYRFHASFVKFDGEMKH